MINNKEKLYELGGTLPDQHQKWDRKKAAAELNEMRINRFVLMQYD